MWDKTVLKFQSFAAAFWRLYKCWMTNLRCTCFPPGATAALTPWNYQSHVKVHAIYYEPLPDLKCTLNVMSQTCSDEPQQFSASCCLQFSIFTDCLPFFFLSPPLFSTFLQISFLIFLPSVFIRSDRKPACKPTGACKRWQAAGEDCWLGQRLLGGKCKYTRRLHSGCALTCGHV